MKAPNRIDLSKRFHSELELILRRGSTIPTGGSIDTSILECFECKEKVTVDEGVVSFFYGASKDSAPVEILEEPNSYVCVFHSWHMPESHHDDIALERIITINQAMQWTITHWAKPWFTKSNWPSLMQYMFSAFSK